MVALSDIPGSNMATTGAGMAENSGRGGRDGIDTGP
jgi:hypothetical protein